MTKTYRFIPLQYETIPVNQRIMASQRFLNTMLTRRTVRDFSDAAVPFELIENAIRTASSAPSGANQQPWTFVVVSNPDIKRQIREAAEAEERENYERRMSDEWLQALAPLGTDWHKPHIEDAPYLIVVFRHAYGIENAESGEVKKVKYYYTEESVGIAVGMLLASLHYAGLATLTHTPSPMAFLREILGRPANERPYVLIPVGYPAKTAMVPDIQKKEIEEVMVVFE